ncbi:MAG: hypothetical protein HY343_06320, partial [Lentisphaerae bacterium]|nr:hypothetical protein [Lentisphaerota bacterium]
GLDAAAVLARLGELSRKPIPDNVARQIRDWAAQCRKVEVSTAVLFHCADRETALRVLAAGGKKLALISDTVVALSEPKALKDIQKKLRQNGITRA